MLFRRKEQMAEVSTPDLEESTRGCTINLATAVGVAKLLKLAAPEMHVNAPTSTELNTLDTCPLQYGGQTQSAPTM